MIFYRTRYRRWTADNVRSGQTQNLTGQKQSLPGILSDKFSVNKKILYIYPYKIFKVCYYRPFFFFSSRRRHLEQEANKKLQDLFNRGLYQKIWKITIFHQLIVSFKHNDSSGKQSCTNFRHLSFSSSIASRNVKMNTVIQAKLATPNKLAKKNKSAIILFIQGFVLLSTSVNDRSSAKCTLYLINLSIMLILKNLLLKNFYSQLQSRVATLDIVTVLFRK